MTDPRLDLLVLRLAVARDQGRLRTNAGLEVRVLAGQLAELALAGVLIDHEGRPAIVSDEPVAGGAFDALLERLAELSGWRWDQLFWRQGVYAKAVLEQAVAELVDAEVWVRTARARPFRPATYADVGGAGLRDVVDRLDGVISQRAPGTTRERVLVALTALVFERRPAAAWMMHDWVAELPDRPEPEREAVQSILAAAREIAGLMRRGGSSDPVATGF